MEKNVGSSSLPTSCLALDVRWWRRCRWCRWRCDRSSSTAWTTSPTVVAGQSIISVCVCVREGERNREQPGQSVDASKSNKRVCVCVTEWPREIFYNYIKWIFYIILKAFSFSFVGVSYTCQLYMDSLLIKSNVSVSNAKFKRRNLVTVCPDVGINFI